MEENLKKVMRLFKLLIELQENKGKQVCNEIVHQNLSKTDTLKKLKPSNYTSEAKNTIVSNAIS